MDVAAFGELLIDFTLQGTDESGYPTMQAHPGGAPPNFLAALSKFGASTAMISKVGDDTFGHLLVRTMEDIGINASGVLVSKDVFTTLAFVTLDAHGDREFSFARKPGSDTCIRFEEIDLSLIDRASVFHFGTLSLTHEPARTATRKCVAYAKSKGKLISLDPNLRPPLWDSMEEAKEQLLWAVSQADILKISDNEVEFLFGLDPESGAKYIMDHFDTQLVYVTCGAQGCCFRSRAHAGHVHTLQGVHVVDTTGAGDIFGGSAMWKLLRTGKRPGELTHDELTQIVRFACTAASLSTTRQGGANSVPSLQEVLENM